MNSSGDPQPIGRLLTELERALKARNHSRKTAQAYLGWLKRFVAFHRGRSPASMGTWEVNDFLTSLANDDRLSPATQNQAASALLFVYRDFLGRPLGPVNFLRAKRSKKLPVVLSRREVRAVLGRLSGPHHLIASILYGSGLRISEVLHLRLKDVDFRRAEITVRRGKGGKDRITMLSNAVAPALREQVERASARFKSCSATPA